MEEKEKKGSIYLIFIYLDQHFTHEQLHVNIHFLQLCGSLHDIPLPSVYIGIIVSLGFPWEKPRLAGCTTWTEHVFLNIHLCCALPLLQFKCCGWNNYTDWSWNLYFNCTDENPSSERCAVPYSCCTPVPGEVRSFLNSLITYATRMNVMFSVQCFKGSCH